MPDISMCNNRYCTLRFLCFRYRAIPKPTLQSMGAFRQDEKGECEYFASIEDAPNGAIVPVVDIIKREANY